MITYDVLVDSNAYIKRTVGSGESSPSTNTKAIWHCNEASWVGITNEVRDSSGNARHGTAYGSSSTSVGKIGRCGYFPGGSDYVLIPGSTDFNFGASFNFSISLWIKTYDIVTITQCILSKLNSSAQYGYYIQINPDSVTFGIDEAGNVSEVSSTIQVDDTSWHNIVCIRDTSGTVLSLYIDGFLNNTATVTPRNVNGVYTLSLGRKSDVSQYYSGYIDEVVIWNKALSSSEVADLYYGGLAGFGVLHSNAVVSRYNLYSSITSDAVIKKVSTNTIYSNARIQQTYIKSLDSRAYIKQIDNTESINSDSYIRKTFTNSIYSNSYIQNIYPKTLYSNSLVKKLDNISQILSDSYISVVETEIVSSDAYILKINEEILLSDSSIKKTTDYSKVSDSYIKKLDNFSVRLSDAMITILGIIESLDSLSYIQKTQPNVILSDAYTRKVKVEDIYTNATVKRLAYENSILSDAMIIFGATKSLDSNSYILKSDITNTLTSDAYVLQCGYWSDVWNTTYKVTFTKTINSDAYILEEGLNSIYSNAYIQQTYTKSLNSNLHIKQIYTKLLNSNSNIRVINTTQPQICDATYTNKPELYSAQINI